MAIIIESRPLIRECLLRGIREATGFTVLAAATLRECIWLAKDKKPSVVLISLPEGPERGEGSNVIREAAQGLPEVPILVLSDHDVEKSQLNVREARHCGYISTSMPLEVAIAAIRVIQSGKGQQGDTEVTRTAERIEPQAVTVPGKLSSIFTARQAAVVDALRRGKANKIIAYELKMKESTVKVHVRNIMKRLNARNRTEVSYLAAQLEMDHPIRRKDYLDS